MRWVLCVKEEVTQMAGERQTTTWKYWYYKHGDKYSDQLILCTHGRQLDTSVYSHSNGT